MPAGNFTEPGCVSLIRWLGGIETPRLNVTRVPPRSSPEAWGHYFSLVDQSAATGLGAGCAAIARQSSRIFGRIAAMAITVQTTVSTPAAPSLRTGGSGMINLATVKTMAKG